MATSPTPNSPDSLIKVTTTGSSGRSLLTIGAYAIAVIGVALIAISGFYLYENSRSGSDADQFTYAVPSESLDAHLGLDAPQPEPYVPVLGGEPVPLEQIAPDVAQFASLYPGNLINPKYWSEPEWAGSDPYGGPTIPAGFTPVSSTDLFADVDPTSVATRIRIPSISVDSTVEELQIIDLGNERSYETPDNTVGHIPETSNPGQQGDGWFFAHLESFAAREGNIFRHLPEVAELIKYDPVDVYLETPQAEYVYRVTGTSQVHESELKLSNTDDAQITLVTCWPPRIYDQRVVVDATLIAYRPI